MFTITVQIKEKQCFGNTYSQNLNSLYFFADFPLSVAFLRFCEWRKRIISTYNVNLPWVANNGIKKSQGAIERSQKWKSAGKASEHVAISFGFISPWFGGWMEFSIPIATQKKAKHINLITFDTSFPLVSERSINQLLESALVWYVQHRYAYFLYRPPWIS